MHFVASWAPIEHVYEKYMNLLDSDEAMDLFAVPGHKRAHDSASRPASSTYTPLGVHLVPRAAHTA